MRYMRFGTCLLPTWMMAFSIAGSANKKEKKVLPATVLKAQTVTVVIQSGAREPMSDPTANLKVQQEVEKALMKWGRFRLMPDVQTADLVIAVQKGTGKATETTIGGGPVDNRPVIVEGTDNSIRFGGHQGTPPATTQYPGPETQRPSEGTQIAGSDDRMTVYLGGVDYPPAGWCANLELCREGCVEGPGCEGRGGVPQGDCRSRKGRANAPAERRVRRNSAVGKPAYLQNALDRPAVRFAMAGWRLLD